MSEARVARPAGPEGQVASSKNHDWHSVAVEKLSRVLGSSAALALISDILHGMGVVRLETTEEFRTFTQVLTSRPGFAGAVGGLLSVYLAIHGSTADAVPDAARR